MPPKNNSTRKPFALALRRWRKANGDLTMVDACKHFGIAYRTWQDWEASRHIPRGVARRLLLAELNRVKPEEPNNERT